MHALLWKSHWCVCCFIYYLLWQLLIWKKINQKMRKNSNESNFIDKTKRSLSGVGSFKLTMWSIISVPSLLEKCLVCWLIACLRREMNGTENAIYSSVLHWIYCLLIGMSYVMNYAANKMVLEMSVVNTKQNYLIIGSSSINFNWAKLPYLTTTGNYL